MQDVYRIKPFTMLSWWIANALFAFPLTLVAMGMIGIPLLFIAGLTGVTLNTHPVVEFLSPIAVILFMGFITGACVSYLQRGVLRNHLYWTADKWYQWTMIGSIIGAFAVTLASVVFGDSVYYEEGGILLLMPVFLAVVSGFQYLALREAVKQAWLWIIANIAGGLVFATLPFQNPLSYASDAYVFMSIGLVLLAPIALGFITGFTLLFLFEKKLLPMQVDDTIDDTGEKKTPSVWDKAI